MELFNIPAFGEECIENRANEKSRVFVLDNSPEASFDSYKKLLEDSGFINKEEYSGGNHRFAAYQKGSDGVFLNYFTAISQLTIAAEEDCAYFDFTDTPLEASLPVQITQIELEDFGMSYVIRLSDGRFIVIDGGRHFEPDRDRLLNCLIESSGGEKPVIAAWILTHPHADHYGAIADVASAYYDEVVLERTTLATAVTAKTVHLCIEVQPCTR